MQGCIAEKPFHNISHDMLKDKTEMCKLCHNLVKKMQSRLNHFIQSVRLVDQLHLGKETLLACPSSAVLSHVLINIIVSDFYENEDDLSVMF